MEGRRDGDWGGRREGEPQAREVGAVRRGILNTDTHLFILLFELCRALLITPCRHADSLSVCYILLFFTSLPKYDIMFYALVCQVLGFFSFHCYHLVFSFGTFDAAEAQMIT